MLERTASTLESCSFQRVLSKPRRTSRRYRQLHTGFWQHGASAFELSTIWPLSTTAVEGDRDAPDRPVRPLNTGLLASAFLLDFLYPSGAYSLLRRLYPKQSQSQDGPLSNISTRRRKFSSHTVAVEEDGSGSLLCSVDDGHLTSEQVSRGATRGAQRTLLYPRNPVIRAGGAVLDVQSSALCADESSSPSSATCKANYETLVELLDRSRGEPLYHDVWDLYSGIDAEQKKRLRPSVVVYLAECQSKVAMDRALSLLHQIPIEAWDDTLQTAAVLLYLRAGDKAAALDVLSVGLASRPSNAGFEKLLSDTLAKKDWPVLLKLWLRGHVGTGKLWTEVSLIPDTTSIQILSTIPDLASLYFDFKRYLDTEAAAPVRAMKLYQDTRAGLHSLRRWFAEQALRQPCLPKHAAVILQDWEDSALYQGYLSRMLGRWNNGFENRASLVPLTEIYRNYRGTQTVKTPIPLLRKMFSFYYPYDTAGLAEVYKDWHQTWGDLDKWGYEKFLKFYAVSGDVHAVKDLWARYTQRFPDMLKVPQGFRSILNVYAQIGDVAGAEEEMRTMSVQHGVKPDIDSWNTLLKCYTKTNDQARALQCFKEIQGADRPDSYTYAQIMAMAAKKGDLATVLHYFDLSQAHSVAVSKEMALSLVMAYCHNERLLDAEKICIKFTERNATSVVVWNQLIYFNGVRGKLDKCYSLLESMKRHGLEWDRQTYEFLLQAMIRVGQTEPAYRLVKSASEDRSFPVGPEHFSIVMSGAVRAGQLELAGTILHKMRSAGLAVPFKAHVAFVEAAVRRDPSAARCRGMAKDLMDHLRGMHDLAAFKRQIKDIGRAVMLLVKLRDYPAVEEFVTASMSAFPEHQGRSYFPPDIAAALMQGFLQDGKHHQVHKMWKQTMQGVVANCTNSTGSAYPARQYDLAQPLNIIVKTFGETRDGRSLVYVVEAMMSSGFRLTRANWNLVVRHLAELGQWERAMSWCEQKLMGRWRGWTPPGRSLQERRELSSTRVLAASKSTVFSLQRQWLKLRRLAAWSGTISSKLKEIEHRFPLLHHAFLTTEYEHLPATWVLPRRRSMTRAIKDLLRPLSRDELRAMKRALERQLRREKKRRWSRTVVHSPFHVVTRRDGKTRRVMTRALRDIDLKNLGVMLMRELAEQ